MSPISWTAPRTWLSGEKPSAATFNLDVRDNLLFLKDGLGGAHINYKQTTAQSLPNVAITKIINLVAVDVGADITYSAGDFTVAKAGVYVGSISIGFALSATGNRQCYIYVNGVSVAQSQALGDASVSPRPGLAKTFRLAANDVVAMHGYQNSGGALNTVADISTTLSLTRIGA